MIDLPPGTLNPRDATDATSQRIDALLYRGLTRVDADLNTQPDLAQKWGLAPDGHSWWFELVSDAKDHLGRPIGPGDMVECLESYRKTKPTSHAKSGFPTWVGTHAMGAHRIIMNLSKSDPYVPRNASLLRFFRTEEGKSCAPTARALVGSGAYKTAGSLDESKISLIPAREGLSPVDFVIIRDENTRAMALIKGDVDLTSNGVTLAKTRWIQKEYSDRLRVVERRGGTVGYVGFNLRDSLLSHREVRQAIAHAIPREEIIHHKMFGFGTLASSFLSPDLAEAGQFEFSYDPALSERLLESAGFPRSKDGVRLSLKMKTTPVREGYETAVLLQDSLSKIGIRLELEIVEPLALLALIRQGKFQVYASRWIGVSDGSILWRTLHSGEPNNRVGYSNPEMDRILESAMNLSDPTHRAELLKKAQALMLEDLPYFPLWFWSNAVIVRNELADQYPVSRVSLSGALEPLIMPAQSQSGGH